MLKEENIDKTMDQTENTSISPSEDGITVKKRVRGCPIKHKLPCAVFINRKPDTLTQALYEGTPEKKRKGNTEGVGKINKDGNHGSFLEQPLPPISDENKPLKKR